MLNTEKRQEVTYFTGIEVENTVMKGKGTLFVVGIRPVDEILNKVTYCNNFKIDQLYFGTSQSFTPATSEDWKAWNNIISTLLKRGWWITLDYDVEYAEKVHEQGWHEFNTFIPMISVKLPFIMLNNYNATIKFDDKTWGATNPGVWSYNLYDLLDTEKFTSWNEYTGDKAIK